MPIIIAYIIKKELGVFLRVPGNDQQKTIWIAPYPQVIMLRTGIDATTCPISGLASVRGSLLQMSSWDNKNEFETYYPYMQDAAAHMIFANKINYRIFVSMIHKFYQVS